METILKPKEEVGGNQREWTDLNQITCKLKDSRDLQHIADICGGT